MRPLANADWLSLALILLISSAAVVLIACAYWPGIMIDDARWQYQQVVENAYEDWHPPLMAWIWRRLTFVEPGPGPMLLLQLALGWAGIVLVATSVWKRGQPLLAVALACVAWLPAPLVLSATVVKDCLMAGALTSAAGLLLWRDLLRQRLLRLASSLLLIVLLLFAAALRLNAVFACLPLAIAALPRAWTSSWLKLVAAACACSIVCLGVGPLVSRLVDAEKTGVELSLIIFDLGGITEHSQVSVFPDLGVRDPVAVNHRCYDPVQWDSYSTWARTPCPIGFEAMQDAVDDDDLHPVSLWLHAIAAHPLAYAEHRLTHFNLSTWFLVPSNPEAAGWTQSVDNPWHYRIHEGATVRAVESVADAAARTPLGWPIFWISVGLAAFVLALSIRAPPPILAITASPPLYGLGFLLVGVAVGMRYYVWTISGAALGALLVPSQLASSPPPRWQRLLRWPALIVLLPTVAAVAARFLGG